MTKIFPFIFLAFTSSFHVYACTLRIKFTDWNEIADMQKRLSLQSRDSEEINLKGNEGEFAFERPASESILLLHFEGFRYKISFSTDLCDST